jgi:phosphatidate phosphatase APP1
VTWLTQTDRPCQTGPVSTIDEMHRPAKLDLAVLRWRARWAIRHGYRPAVIAYTCYGSSHWVRVLCRVVLSRRGVIFRGDPTGARGWRSFVSVPVENGEVDLVLNGVRHTVRADYSGVVDVVVEQEMEPGRHTITMSSQGSDPVAADVFVIGDEERFGIVSDIDDTVMVTALPRPLLAAWHTFVVNEHARSATPGMPVLYERLSQAYGFPPIFYLSTGAWNVAPTLTRFLSSNLYPPGPLLLTDWGPTKDRWFRSGKEHKRAHLRRWAQEFPNIKWLLFGDNGQHDEMLYREFADAHPEQVVAVCIRQLTPGEAVLAGSSLRESPSPEGSRVPWLYAYDGAGLGRRLEKIGVLPHEQSPQNTV